MNPPNPNKNKHPELVRAARPIPGSNKSLLQDDLFDEANYPAEWNIEFFKSLPTFAKRVAYAKTKLGKLGQGSARIVFDVDENTVLKLARNDKGIAQNNVESDIGMKGWYSFVAKVFDAEPNDLWIESEKARKMNAGDFKRLVGFGFRDWCNTLDSEYRVRNGKGKSMYLSIPNYDQIKETELLSDMVGYMMDFDVPPGDLTRINSWGIVNRDGQDVPVLVDYGLTTTVYNDFYAPPGFRIR